LFPSPSTENRKLEHDNRIGGWRGRSCQERPLFSEEWYAGELWKLGKAVENSLAQLHSRQFDETILASFVPATEAAMFRAAGCDLH
jgi:hypothetical protein